MLQDAALIDTTRKALLTEARTWLETPFHHQGRCKGVGVDCIGLMTCSAKEVGIQINDIVNYSREPDGKTLEKEISLQLQRIPIEEAKIMDVLLFWFFTPKLPCHVGFKTDIGLLHTYQNVKKVVETSLSVAWRHHLHSAYRFKEFC